MPAQNQVELLGVAGEYARQRIPLSSQPLIVGKDSRKAQLILSDQLISRTHCEIRAEGGRVYVEDLGSLNGTYVNDRKVDAHTRIALRDGDQIALAGCEIFRVVEISQAAQAPEDTVFTPRREPAPPQFQKPILSGIQSYTQTMDLDKLSVLLFSFGGILLLAALLWWAWFYGGLVSELGGDLTDAIACLYSSGGACGFVNSLAQLGGGTPYNPFIFWLGTCLMGVGGILKLALRPSR